MNTSEGTQDVYIYHDESTNKCRVQITGIYQYVRIAKRKNFTLIAAIKAPIQQYKRTHYFEFEIEDPIKQMIEISGCRKLTQYLATEENPLKFVQMYESTDPMYFCKLKFMKRIYKVLAKQTPSKIPIIGDQQSNVEEINL